MQATDREFILGALDLLLREPSVKSCGGRDGPWISVILPVFNRPKMVDQALVSLAGQIYRDFEVIVVDDGSTDETPAVLAEWSKRDPRIRVLRNPERCGVAAARNRALAAACGEVVTYLDSDNLMYRHALAAIAEQFELRPGTWSIYASQAWSAPDGSLSVRCPQASLADLCELRHTFDLNAFSHRRALYDALGGFDESLTRLVDWEFILRYAKLVMPRRVAIPVSHYEHGRWPRITNEESFAVNAHRAMARHRTELGFPLRVLYIVHSFPQVSETYIVAESRYMQARGVSVLIWSQREPEVADPELRADPAFAVTGGDLAKTIAAFRPDVIHVHWANFFEQYAAVLAAAGVPVTVRGHSFELSPELLRRILDQPALRAVYVFPTQTALLDTGNPLVKPVPVCFDPGQYQPSQDKDRRLVLRTGVALPTKDIECFIEVAARCPDHRFVLFVCQVVGNPGYLDNIVEANRRCGSPVDIRINRPASEVARWMRHAGIYLHTCNPELSVFGMPISIAEAMATGAYVLARASEGAALYLGRSDALYGSPDEAAALIRATLGWDEQRWRREFAHSVEQAFRNHAPETTARLILDDWLAMTEAWFMRPIEAAGLPEVGVDDVLQFGRGGNGVAALRTGFHEPEAWGVWSGQSRSVLAFAAAGADWPTVDRLVMRAVGNTAPDNALAVSVTINGRDHGTIAVRAGVDQIVPLRGPPIEPGSVLAVTLASPVRSPRDTGSGDLRRLGVGLTQIAFRRQAEAVAEGAAEDGILIGGCLEVLTNPGG